MNKTKLTYDDVCIVPAVTSSIRSRSECNPYDDRDMLPIFTAPMDSVVSEGNAFTFVQNRINVIMPRTIDFQRRLNLNQAFNRWIAVSLEEAKWILQGLYDYPPTRICIDIANGHMEHLIELVRDLKRTYPEMEIMTGNIANPQTYREYEKAGLDFIRCSVGTGSGCLTSSNTAIHYPQFSLLEDLYRIKKEINGKCKIIADGGIRGYRDIQKALVFADYVMIGGLFNRMLESAGRTTYGKFYTHIRGRKIFRPLKTLFNYGKEVDVENPEIIQGWKDGKFTLWKKFYGMSTKEAQRKINPNGPLKTSEGLVTYQKVESTLSQWVENEIDYLRSAMSYTGSRTLEEYKDSEYIVMTQRRFND